MGLLVPLFCTSSDVSSEFQNQSGQPYSHLAEAYIPLHVQPVVRYLLLLTICSNF